MVRFDDDFPLPPSASGRNDPSPLNDIRPVLIGDFHHLTEFDFGEAAVHHALEEMRAELEVPIPPLRPFLILQTATLLPFRFQHCSRNVAVRRKHSISRGASLAPAA